MRRPRLDGHGLSLLPALVNLCEVSLLTSLLSEALCLGITGCIYALFDPPLSSRPNDISDNSRSRPSLLTWPGKCAHTHHLHASNVESVRISHHHLVRISSLCVMSGGVERQPDRSPLYIACRWGTNGFVVCGLWHESISVRYAMSEQCNTSLLLTILGFIPQLSCRCSVDRTWMWNNG
ncbi:hypothetical protein C8Q76DRAFT_444610 [Earliella scabrosa]|nr:hypothetical protein C8Q76DRAFT_444610 [Earliella scabrosa]